MDKLFMNKKGWRCKYLFLEVSDSINKGFYFSIEDLTKTRISL
jgi:hypothetical protein